MSNNFPMYDAVVLVDEEDNAIGFDTKINAHKNGGKLHRAFSVFIFNANNQVLLQCRSAEKYHFGNLWSNTCCSHPRGDEAVIDAAHRRLQEEFGFHVELTEIFSFIYRASDPTSGLTEHEYDHILFGKFNGQPKPNPAEISDWKWIDMDDLIHELKLYPFKYTPWLKVAVDEMQFRAEHIVRVLQDIDIRTKRQF